jgi:hypothetical protein
MKIVENPKMNRSEWERVTHLTFAFPSARSLKEAPVI